MTETLAATQGTRLLELVRETIGHRLGLTGKISRGGLEDEDLQQSLGTFVTLKIHGRLRGCIGNLEPDGNIIESIGRNALSAAFHDHRFSPLSVEEFDQVEIDISVLTAAQALDYSDANDLCQLLRPGIDGVILREGKARATFLPQVWSQLPDPQQFLDHLCMKAGLPRSAWRDQHPEVYLYQVQCFEEGTA